MTGKLCPIRGAGQKKCEANCAWHTPIGCAMKVVADQLVIASVARVKEVTKRGKKDGD